MSSLKLRVIGALHKRRSRLRTALERTILTPENIKRFEDYVLTNTTKGVYNMKAIDYCYDRRSKGFPYDYDMCAFFGFDKDFGKSDEIIAKEGTDEYEMFNSLRDDKRTYEHEFIVNTLQNQFDGIEFTRTYRSGIDADWESLEKEAFAS